MRFSHTHFFPQLRPKKYTALTDYWGPESALACYRWGPSQLSYSVFSFHPLRVTPINLCHWTKVCVFSLTPRNYHCWCALPQFTISHPRPNSSKEARTTREQPRWRKIGFNPMILFLAEISITGVMRASQQTVIFSLTEWVISAARFKIRAGEIILLPQQSVGIRFMARDNSDKIPRDKCDS